MSDDIEEPVVVELSGRRAVAYTVASIVVAMGVLWSLLPGDDAMPIWLWVATGVGCVVMLVLVVPALRRQRGSGSP